MRSGAASARPQMDGGTCSVAFASIIAETQSDEKLRSLIAQYTLFQSFSAEHARRLAARAGIKAKAKHKQGLEKRWTLLVSHKINAEAPKLLDVGRKKEWPNQLEVRSCVNHLSE